MEDGQVPYRDFAVEYPPGALPVFVVPRARGLRRLPRRLRVADGALRLRRASSRSRSRDAALGFGFGTLAFVALSPLAIGSVILTRFDLWPAMLASFALAALVHDRLPARSRPARRGDRGEALPRSSSLPLTVAYVWRRRGAAGGARLRGARGRGPARRLSPVPCARARGRVRSVGRQLVAAAPDREPRLGGPARGARSLRDRRRGGLEPRLAEPRRAGADALAVALSVAQIAVLAWLWLRFARWGAPSPAAARRCRGGRHRVRRARQGALAAVPDLARPARRRRGRRGPPRTRCSPPRSC